MIWQFTITYFDVLILEINLKPRGYLIEFSPKPDSLMNIY